MPLAEVTTFDVQAILSLLVYTGLRVSELVDLRLRDVEINARSGKVCVYRKGRGKKYREVPLHVEARKAVQAYLELRPGPKSEDDYLLLGQRGPLRERGVQFRLEDIARKKAQKRERKRLKMKSEDAAAE